MICRNTRPLNNTLNRSNTWPLSGPLTSNSTRPLSGLLTRNSTRPLSEPLTRNSTRPLSEPLTRNSTQPLNEPLTRNSARPLTGTLTHNSSRPLTGTLTRNSSRPLTGTLTRNSSRPLTGTLTRNSSRPLTGTLTRNSSLPLTRTLTRNSSCSRPLTGSLTRNSSRPLIGTLTRNSSQPLIGTLSRNSSRPLIGTLTRNNFRPLIGTLPRDSVRPLSRTLSNSSNSRSNNINNLSSNITWPLQFSKPLIGPAPYPPHLFLSSPMEKKARHCFVPASISSQKLHTPSVPLLSQAHQNAPTGETSNHSAIVSTVPTQRPLARTPHTLQFTQSPTDIPQTVMLHHALPTTTESTPCMPVQKMCIPASEQSVRTLHAHNESGIEHVDSPLAMIKSSSPLHPGMCPLVVVKRLPLQFPFCERVNLSSELLSNEYSSCFDEGPMASIGNGEKSQKNNSRVLLSDVSLMEHSSLDLTTVLKDEKATAKSTSVCSVERCSPDSSTVEVSSKVWEIFLARHLNMISDGTECQASDISSNHPTTLMTNLHADLRELAAAGRCPLPCISRLQRVFAPVGALRDLMFSPLLETAVVKIFRRRGVVLRPATLREERELEVVWPMRQNVPRTFTLFPLDKLHEVYMDLIQAAIGDRRKGESFCFY
uniref:Uncharacterized protein n=1 Tax=Eptatretus burgeri TaxID=7764 RepID=A0A8C4R0G2_EPTBU